MELLLKHITIAVVFTIPDPIRFPAEFVLTHAICKPLLVAFKT